MLRLSRRPLTPHAVLLACLIGPAAVASGLGASTGCADLIEPINNDSGITGTGDTGAKPGEDAGTLADGAPAPLYDCATEDAGFGAPNDLACTGLYSSFPARTIASNVKPFDPGLAMWNDGATSLRWILLPAGAKIDTSDMNEWTFPIGTKAWQELTLGEHRVETRFFWKRGTGDWVRGPYVWSADGASYAQYTTTGVLNVGGSSYDVPPVADCDTCHVGRIDQLLGVEAVSLAQASASGVTIATLTAGAQLTVVPPAGSLVIPDDGTGLAAPALAWLHSNCGTSCHSASPAANAASTGLLLRLDVSQGDAGLSLGDVYDTNTYVTSVNITPQLDPFDGEGWHRITPNDTFDGGIGTSLVPFCAGSRGVASVSMPPIDTAVPDITDLNALKAWISRGTFPPGTYP